LEETVKYADLLVQVLAQPAAIIDGNGTVLSCNSGFQSFFRDGKECNRGADLCHFVQSLNEDELRQSLSSKTFTRPIEKRVEMPSGEFRLSIKQLPGPSTAQVFLCELSPDFELEAMRLQYLMEHLDQGIWNYDLREKRLLASTAWRRIRNLPFDFNVQLEVEKNSDWWLERIHPEDQENVKRSARDLTTGRADSAEIQYRFSLGNGDWKWIFARSKVVMRDGRGKPLQLIGLDTDVTMVKQDEIDHIELANKLQLAIEVAGMGVWEFDSATSRVHWNDQQLKIYGLTDQKNNLPQNVWETLLHPEDLEANVAKADRAMHENGEFRSDFRIIRPDGEIRYVRSAARHVAVSGSSGKMLGVNVDVTKDYRRAEELERARQRLEHDSRHDALTGLANRRLLDEFTKDLLRRLGPTDEFAVLHIDLDHFKQVNDTLGHAAGDQVLIRVADKLKSLVGDTGLVCRNGGDEFVVLLERFGDEKSLRKLCEEMIRSVGEPVVMKGGIRNVGLSIGCVIASGDLTDPSDAFINADVALYAAKSDGRSCYKVFVPGMRSVSRADVTNYHDLTNAMETGQLTCFYQPQFDAETRKVVGAEALVRWNCPRRGTILPQDFLDMAEAAGLSSRIDECVLDAVLAAQTRWMQAGLQVPTVALNVSMQRLLEPDMVRKIQGKLKAYHAISFELLETAFFDERTDALDLVLSDLQRAGIRIDLDDFGSGHSSVVALQSIKPDRVKMDRMLIAPLQENAAQLHIVEALVRVARLEGCGVVVEGIETSEQLEAVGQLECEVLQGFLLGRPVSEAEFVKYLTPSVGSSERSA